MNNMQQLYFGNLALDPNRQRRIVYYGRVSTEHEAQLEALEKQMQWYEDQTKYHPNWTVVGKYIDAAVIIGLKTLRLKKCQKHAAF